MFKLKPRLRTQLLIDAGVQLPFLQRAALYTAACAVYFMVILYCSESNKIDNESAWRSIRQCFDVFAAWAPGLTMLAPIIAFDILAFTHRFAGPMFRLRREMRRLVDNESAAPVQLREHDHWTEIAELFNELREELITLRNQNNPVQKNLFAANQEAADSHDDLLGNVTQNDSANTSGNIESNPDGASNAAPETGSEPDRATAPTDDDSQHESIEPANHADESASSSPDGDPDDGDPDDGELSADEQTRKMFAQSDLAATL